MPQSRLFLAATQADAARMLDLIGDSFEEDGFAMATMEMDEKADRWEVSLYVEEAELEDAERRLAACLRPHFLDAAIEREVLPDIDWVAKSLEGLKPVRAGRFLVHGSHDRARVRPGDVAIEIDAGQAFGTGHHGTTAGCLEMMEWLVRRRRPSRVLDLGTGSGVLAIAAAMATGADVLATDIDPVATEVAQANARMNGVASRLRFATAAGFHSDVFSRNGPFDMIVANILARPLMRMAPAIGRHLAPGGDLVLSGILAEQRLKVLSAFTAQRLHHRRTLWRNGWVTLHLA